jgi:putative transcription factor
MEHQDWNTITYKKPKILSKEDKIKRQNPSRTKDFKKLDSDEPPIPTKLNHDLKILIQKKRQELNLTQKNLANKINVKVNIINDYETGKCIPDKIILQKIKNVLNIK